MAEAATVAETPSASPAAAGEWLLEVEDLPTSFQVQPVDKEASAVEDLSRQFEGQPGVLRVVPEWSHVAGPGGQVLLRQEHDPLAQVIVSHYQLDSVHS